MSLYAALQRKIAARVLLDDNYSRNSVAGVDQAFISTGDEEETIISGAVVLDPSFKVIDTSHFVAKTKFPYIPGLLSFREGPAAMGAVERLKVRPTLLFVDGCGINHPRQVGLASHIGVMMDIPTVGVSKNVLCGVFDPPGAVGEASPLVYGGKHVGYVFFSKKNCRPIVVAPGHMVSVDSALELARSYLGAHKLPEPCWQAHKHVNEVKRRLKSGTC
jgi:deoxyribonuclease V